MAKEKGTRIAASPFVIWNSGGPLCPVPTNGFVQPATCSCIIKNDVLGDTVSCRGIKRRELFDIILHAPARLLCHGARKSQPASGVAALSPSVAACTMPSFSEMATGVVANQSLVVSSLPNGPVDLDQGGDSLEAA